MTPTLIRDTELAEQFGIDLERLHRLRRERHWPCVKFARNDVRFTEDQVTQILEMQTAVTGQRGSTAGKGKGQTTGSAARSRP